MRNSRFLKQCASSIGFLLVLMLFFNACQSGPEINKDVEPASEVKKRDKVSGSSMYQNPVSADKPLSPKDAAMMEFEAMAFDFGAVKEGDKVEHVYKFKNTGKAPLTITNARGTCGCTVPQWPRNPVMPGDEGEIKVIFNSAGKLGKQEKEIIISANTIPNKTKLRISGKVIK